MLRRVWWLIAIATVVLSARVARADDAAAKRRAQEYFEIGRRHHEVGEYDKAAAAYKRAYTEWPSPAFLFNLAQVYRLGGKLELAVEYYRKYLDKEPKGSVADEARRHLAAIGKLDQRASSTPATLRIQVEPGTARIRVDDSVVESVGRDSASHTTDLEAGVHSLAVSGRGRLRWKERVDVDPGETLELRLKLGRRQGPVSRGAMWGLGSVGFGGIVSGLAIGVRAHLTEDPELAPVADVLLFGGTAAMLIARAIYWLDGDTPTRVELTRRR